MLPVQFGIYFANLIGTMCPGYFTITMKMPAVAIQIVRSRWRPFKSIFLMMWPNKRVSMRLNRPEPIIEECYWKLKKCPEVSQIYYYHFLGLIVFYLFSCNGSWSWHFHKQYTYRFQFAFFQHLFKLIVLFLFYHFFCQINSSHYSCDDVCKSWNNPWDYVSCWRFEYDWFGWICILQHRSIFGVSVVSQSQKSARK